MSDASFDDFSAFDFPEFTDQDFAQIDAAVAHSLNSPQASNQPSESYEFAISGLEDGYHLYTFQTNSGPKIPVEIETLPDSDVRHQSSTIHALSERSPLQRYRPKHILSVTDLVAPAWCEVQFEYGLLGKRSRPLAQRPKSFISTSGKEIRVEQTTAVKNEQNTKQGKAVHKKLEREIHPEEVKVTIATEEERWALRLVNMMHCLKEVALEGFTREMPVFGLIEQEVVVGIIDEVSRVPSEFIGTDDPTYCLRITDTKTRKTESLPPDEDTLSARLQVMLYHRLLSGLLSQSQPFQFSSFWEKLNLKTSKPFSPNFLIQAGLTSDNRHFACACLDELSNSWLKLIPELGFSTVHPTLQLSYRLRSPSRPLPKLQQQSESTSQQNSEELMMQWAILQSLSPATSSDLDSQHATSSHEQLALTQSPLTSDDGVGHSRVIGMKEIVHDDAVLDTHISNVLRWWHGERKPEGVPLALSRRCRTCEYNDDCEWRARKAEESLRNIKQKNYGNRV
ncbi:exonuclease V a 5' deoxyribonuclease-domain-containing protein [Cyathus striatus]|nr:exonuclease V a 5' deoxyribonuclease-domain-containing protein [Cyathus striatus]